MSASITAAAVASAGTASVTVVNPAPGGGTSNVVYFPVATPMASVSMSRADFTVPPGGQHFVAGDLNGDGALDLALVHASNWVSIWLGNGLEGVTASAGFSETGPVAATLGDFNGNGVFDLATISAANTVSIRLGNGDGTFQASTSFATGEAPQDIVTADFNGDGWLDLAIAREGFTSPPAVSVLLGNGDGTFQGFVDYLTEAGCHSVAVGDFNVDGVLDLAVGNVGTGNVSILLGNGDGTFQSQTTFFVSADGAYAVITADFNGDGLLDLAVTTAGGATGDLSVLLGNGDGTFQAGVSSPHGVAPAFLTAQDFNGDGTLDLAVTDLSGLLGIHLGNGDGTFQAPTNTGLHSPFGLSAADFNEDGRIDVAVTNINASHLSVLLQTVPTPAVQLDWVPPGTGSFGDQLVGTTSGVQQVTLTNSGTANLQILAGFTVEPLNGTTVPEDFGQNNDCPTTLPPGPPGCTVTALFTPQSPGLKEARIVINTDDPVNPTVYITLTGTGLSEGAVGGLPATVDFGDVAVNTSKAQKVTMTNNGAGTLGISGILITGDFAVEPDLTTCSATLASGASCDINLLFNPLTSGPSAGQLTINHDAAGSPAVVGLLGNGFVPQPLAFMNQPLVPGSIAPGGDAFTLIVNGTGFTPDSIVHWNGSARVTTFVSSSQVTAAIPSSDIAAPSTASVTVVNPAPGGGTSNVAFFHIADSTTAVSMSKADISTGMQPRFVISGDINDDGAIDLVAVNHTDNTFAYFQGAGNGTFAAGVAFSMAAATGSLPIDGVVGDFNGDGNLDLAITHPKSAPLAFGDKVTIHAGDGSGGFAAPGSVFTTGSSDTGIAAADLNQDGKLDLAIGSCDQQAVYIHSGNGDGTFTQTAQLVVGGCSGGAYLRVATGDVNKDEDLDLIAVNSSANRVAVLLSDGTGGFGSPSYYDVGTFPWAAALADFNGDGNLDMTVGNDDGTVSVLLGNADGTFQAHVQYAANTTPISLVTGDFNGDVKLDIAVADRGSNTVSMLLGNGDGSFQPKTDYATGALPTFLTSGDFNGDGRLDLATANGSANTVSVLLQVLPAPAVSLSTSAVHFTGNPLNLDCPSKDVTVTNTGQADLLITDIVASTHFSETDTCPRAPAALAAGANCVVSVKFHPIVVGPESGTVTITSNAPGSPHAITAAGNGTPACQLLAKVRTVTILRGTDLQDFAIEDAKPSCTPVDLSLTCSVENPAACLLNPAVIAPSGSSTLKVSNLRQVGADALQIEVTSTSEFRLAKERVTVRFADFAFTKSPSEATVAAGGVATYSLVVRPVNGLTGRVTFACSGAPRGATCTVEPSSITLDGTNVAQLKVRVTTSSGAGALPAIPLPDDWTWVSRRTVLLLLGLTALLAVAAEARRRVPETTSFRATNAGVSTIGGQVTPAATRLALAVMVLAILLWASCGGGGTSFSSGGTPTGSYPLVVTGTYSSATGPTPGTLSNSTTVTLKVN